MRRPFWQSKAIPEEYRKWFDKQFQKVLNSKPDMANGTDAKGAIEDIVEDFKKEVEKVEKNKQSENE